MAATASENNHGSSLAGLAKASAGAVIFSFPMLMTMELWSLGASLDGYRIALFTLLSFPLLVGLSYYDGFEVTSTVRDDVRDALAAYAIGFVTSALVLLLFNIINFQTSFDGSIGRIALQAVPAAIGATAARGLLQTGEEKSRAQEATGSATYVGQLFLMAAGAIFLSMSVAPTEEMVLIGFKMSAWHTVALVTLSLVIMQCFIYAIERTGHSNSLSPDAAQWSLLLRYTFVGYALVFAISYYVLWTFGGFDGVGLMEQIESVVVLALPASVGAAASRLIL
jgi:putative integral membrane protein (TIGR02587 family)